MAGEKLGLVTTTLPEEPDSGRLCRRGGRGGEIADHGGKQGLELAIRKGRHGLLDLQRRLLVDAHAGQRGLGKACSDRSLEPRPRVLGNLNQLLRQRRIGPCQIARGGLDRARVGIRAGD